MPFLLQQPFCMNAFRRSNSLNKLTKVLSIALFIVILSACTTQKKRGDVSGLKKFYHNTTALYNGYFHANEIINESVFQLNADHRDNYNKLLEVYPYVASANAQSQSSNIDNAIEKISVVVNLHRISHWTDDCYLLLGKAQFIKQNYEDAQEALEFMAAEYSPEAILAREGSKTRTSSSKSKKPGSRKRPTASKSKKKKASPGSKKRPTAKKKKKKKKKKRKKRPTKRPSKRPTPKEKVAAEKKEEEAKKVEENKAKEKTSSSEKVKTTTEKTKKSSKADEKAEKYFLKHRPAYQEGQIWLARTYIERDMFAEAEVILQRLVEDPLTFKDLRKDILVAQGHLLIQRKDYNPAINPMEEAIALSKDRSEKARLSYIIAQIHQQEGRGEEALAGFERALKFSPNYEMEFSSRLNVAQNAWINGQATSEQALKTLKQMLKDSKNLEYKDQVYFAMAQISIKEKNYSDAIGHLKNSLANNLGNDAQAAESHLLLAQLYYDQEDYVNSKYSYDSTLLVLPKNDERYDQTKGFRDNLTDIAKNIEIITLQDSLLAIAAMTDQDRKTLAYDIQKKREADRLAKAALDAKVSDERSANNLKNNRNPSTFFAYDDKKLRKGKKDFDKFWADRPLEDNWRRSNRNNIGESLAEEQQEEKINRELTDEDIELIFKDVPRTPEQIKAAKEKITNALFTLGTLYKDRLLRNDLAIETLEDLSDRFPGHDQELETWYFLYVIFNEEGNTAKAQEYYTKITNRYPKSLYAQALTDPNFKNRAQQEQNSLFEFYDATYTIFQNGDFKKAHDRVAEASNTFGKTNKLQAKFALLDAMCLGNIKGKDEYIAKLKDVVAQHPGTEEEVRAKEILRLLGSGGVAGVKNTVTAGGKFEVKDQQVHYFIIALNGATTKLTDAKEAVSDYNRKYHQLDRLRISNIYLGASTDKPILVIRRYKNKSEAMRYYNGIQKNQADFFESSVEYEMFAVSQSNYRQILKSKSLEEYKDFFTENYLE